jgi:alkylation response protein AidB-like acyl-CoA dehydrogenase
MLGATEGAYDQFREWIRKRRGAGGVWMAEIPGVQVRMARAAADIDAAELLLRRAAQSADSRQAHSPDLLARSVRDFARAGELIVGAIDALIGLSGTAGFMISNPIQRVWRDVHFASMHVSLNSECNFAHFGRTALGIARTPGQPFF